jgi:hydroxymethylbilane synthase
VKAELTFKSPGLTVDIQVIKTEGDRKQGILAAQSDKKEWIIDLGNAHCFRSRSDLAVHSGKDVPAQLEKGTEVRPALKRSKPV